MQNIAKEIRQSLINAPETKIAQVVRMVDALAIRGPADDLIKPLRSMFAHAMPARPLRFARLLFLPLDTMIVQPAKYRMGLSQIPRTAIMPIASAVKFAMGGASQIESSIANCSVDDDPTNSRAGAMLWVKAGKIVAELATCPGWDADVGLPAQAWLEIRTTFCGAMLVAERICGDHKPGLQTEANVVCLIQDVEHHLPASMTAVLSLLLSLNYNSAHVLSAAARHSNRIAAMSRIAVSQALEEIPNTALAKIGGSVLRDAAAEAQRIEEFLQAVERRGQASRDQIGRARREAASQCANRLDRAVEDEFRPALAGSASDEDIEKFENIARSMRNLQMSGRSLNADPRFEASIETTWALLAHTNNPDMDAADRARIGEIIFGTDRAEQLLCL